MATLKFNFNSIPLFATVTGLVTPHNCGWDTITVTLSTNFSKLTKVNRITALKFVADVIIKTMYANSRAVSLSVKDTQKTFLSLLKDTRRFKQMGWASDNHGEGRKVYYGIVYPYNKNKCRGGSQSVGAIADRKMYAKINNAIITQARW